MAMPFQPQMNLERWLQLMAAWNFAPNRETFDSLVAAYSERGRYYHTAEHVSACLRHLDACAHALEFPREVEIALWFHDAVYKPFSGDNEKASADWAASFLTAQEATEEQVARVHDLIMVTEHNAPVRTRDEAVLVDIDLSILGADARTYEVFESAIRKEYRRVPPMIYRRKRAEILRGFMRRPKIFTSTCFPEDIERQARTNLARAISRLEGRE